MSAPHDTRLVTLHRTPRARRTLVGLSFFGGGTAAYQPWTAHMPPETDLVVVCYPGREGRFAEDFARDWDELATDVTRSLREADLGPYVLFGHSMSGWMAFDVAARLDGDEAVRPRALALSSCNAPDRGLTAGELLPTPQDPDERLLEWLETHGLLPRHVREHAGLTEVALELVRADVGVRNTFVYGGAEVSVPLQVFFGADDPLIRTDAAARWSALTSGAYGYDVLGGGHFYTPEIWRSLPSKIASTVLAPTGTAF
ncbi:thioesterase II family protein [Streptomyces sp. NPDC058735]|uniref:thioesterase II family protein n=1 Tax=unclassified Streptomyces TaxID=2593676 RepID=UPI0036BE5343